MKCECGNTKYYKGEEKKNQELTITEQNMEENIREGQMEIARKSNKRINEEEVQKNRKK